jgi:hypothetical protein
MNDEVHNRTHRSQRIPVVSSCGEWDREEHVSDQLRMSLIKEHM